MSYWTYISGILTVSPMGRTQAEKRYILDTVLNHLPQVSDSERDMNIYTIQKNGTDESCSCDEFGENTNNLIDSYGNKNRYGWLRTQTEYILVVDASLRDRFFENIFKDFQNWICRLAKRIHIIDVLVEVKGYGKASLVRNINNVYGKMFEDPSWCNENGEVNWCEYLVYNNAKNSLYPMMLAYKYFNDEENDKEVERRIEYMKIQK